jgi:hypothetical protein
MNQNQNLHENPNAPVLLPTPLQYLSHYLKMPAVKVSYREHVDGLERVVVHEQSESEYHVICVE